MSVGRVCAVPAELFVFGGAFSACFKKTILQLESDVHVHSAVTLVSDWQ